MHTLRITSEDEAWKAINDTLNGKLPEEITGIEFDGWPTLTLHLGGPKFHGTITTTVMESLIEVQKNLNRSYAKLRYDKSDARHITDEDRDQIELVVKVTEGTSGFEAALENAIEKIAVNVADKMTPEHLIIAVLGLALMYFGHSYFKASQDAKIKAKQIDADLAAKKEDTDRFKLMADAISKVATLRHVRDDADDSHDALLRASASAESAEVLGVCVPTDVASELIKTKRERSKDVRLDGEFTVTVADKTTPDDPRCRLVSPSGADFMALVIDENWTPEQKAKFHAAFWENKSIFLLVNAKELRGNIVAASVVGVGAERK